MTLLHALRRALAAAAAASVLAAVQAYDSLDVPSLDFRTMMHDGAVASQLQALGIVTIRSVPGYAALRREYLHAAAECAWQRRSPGGAQGVLYRELEDGTQRITISSTNGVDRLDGDACPAYQLHKTKFSTLVAQVIDTFSAAFDASSSATANQSLSLRQFVSEARDMDHFHAYVPVLHVKQAGSPPPPSSSQAPENHEDKFALSMHSDSGLFIAMSAPAFYEVRSDDPRLLQEIANPDPESGLLIKLGDGRTVVRPVQKADELTVMIGDGFSTWVQLPVTIPAVVHGMLMPQTSHSDGAQVIRAWFGKMVLLSDAATMLNTGTAFAAYSRELGQFVESGGAFPSHFASAACPAHRQLEQNACSYRVCHPFSPSTTEEQCDFWCNTHSMQLNFADLCQSSCVCQHHAVTDNTFECWMSCFEKSDTCRGAEWCETKKMGDGKEIASRVCNANATGAITATSTTTKLRVKVKAFRAESEEIEHESSEDESSESESV